MSFGQYRILALTLPTVAAFAVISILWFRHHQKKRRPRVDLLNSKEEESSLELVVEETDTRCEAEIKDICVSAEAGSYNPFEEIFEEEIIKTKIAQEESELPESDKLMEDIKKYILNSENNVIQDIYIVKEQESKKLTDSLEELEKMQKEANMICNNIPKKEDISHSLDELDYSDLEDGEIRSPNNSFSGKHNSDGSVSKQDSEDRDSVFADDSEDSSIKGVKRTVALEDTESDLEEGEIRSTDGRTEEIMEKEKEELTEKLASLELNQMKKGVADPKDLPSLELDQMKLDDAKSGSERDSANHSPSEVMLASPSISNFSDAHSEGSSDSGKGQSDAATSPSRTPAGGSSLAGDHAPSVYEFVLPQVIVGRLIGRHGTFLHEIKTQTHTNIFIKRHPDSNKLKICAIEGTQQDIDKALAKIRQKFPLRRFPQLTLEKVSFVQVNPLPPLKPEDFHLQLIEGVNNDVVLSSLITAAHFFLQQPCHPSYGSLATLNSIMSQLYSTGEAPILETPVSYAVCAAPAMGGWYRAQIVSIEEESQVCTVRYLDYGGYSRIPTANLRQIRGDLLALPFQAVECYLANVSPPPGEDEWSEEARLFVQSLTCGQVLQAQVYDYAEDGTPLVYLYSKFANQNEEGRGLVERTVEEATESYVRKGFGVYFNNFLNINVVLINEELVVHGYGVIAESGSSSCGTASEDGGRTDDEVSRTEEPYVRAPKENKVSA